MGDIRILIEQAGYDGGTLTWSAVGDPYANLLDALEAVAELERDMPSRSFRVRAESDDA